MPIHSLKHGAINLREWGEGPPLLLVHGLGTSSDIWRHQIRTLAGHHRVVAVDLPGFGRSQRLPVPATDTHTGILDELAEVCAWIGQPVHYVGTSMGGFYGLELALNHPQFLRSLVLCNTAARNVIPQDVIVQRLEVLRTSSADELGEMVARQALAPQAEPDLREWLHDLVARCSADFYSYYLSVVLTSFDVSHRLSEIELPTLVITGTLDAVIPARFGAELARGLPHATLIELADTGHIACAERPEPFNRAILDFLLRITVDSTAQTSTASSISAGLPQ